MKDFGETTALMLTVASPRPSEVEIQLRAESIRRGIAETRKDAAPGRRVSLVYAFPASTDPKNLRRVVDEMGKIAEARGVVKDARPFAGPGYLGLDGGTDRGEDAIQKLALQFLQDRMRTSELHPDVWRAIVVSSPDETEAKLSAVAESKYSYRELDDYTETAGETAATHAKGTPRHIAASNRRWILPMGQGRVSYQFSRGLFQPVQARDARHLSTLR